MGRALGVVASQGWAVEDLRAARQLGGGAVVVKAALAKTAHSLQGRQSLVLRGSISTSHQWRRAQVTLLKAGWTGEPGRLPGGDGTSHWGTL